MTSSSTISDENSVVSAWQPDDKLGDCAGDVARATVTEILVAKSNAAQSTTANVIRKFATYLGGVHEAIIVRANALDGMRRNWAAAE